MATHDPSDKALVRMELRRFAAHCDNQEGLVQRADTLRELTRLATLPLPYRLADQHEAKDLQRHLFLAAEARARELIQERIDAYMRADPEHRAKIRSTMLEDWTNLTGHLGHLRPWAKVRFDQAEQNGGLGG
jgi:hypothetical protein